MNLDWYAAHREALSTPRGPEVPIVHILRALDDLVPKYKTDYVLREPVAQIMLGLLGLLNGDRGRLDGGKVWDIINGYAEQMGLDLELEVFRA